MNLFIKTCLASAVAASMLTACSSDNDDNSASEPKYTAVFKAMSIGDQVEELLGGVIGIADEVGNGKMGDPMGEDLAGADTTLVESQFSWNSTMDFYNNIVSIKNVWDGGLKEIAEASQPALATTITTEIGEALDLIIDISSDSPTLTTSDLTADNGLRSFRQQIGLAGGRAAITLATTKLADLQANFETLKTDITPTDAEKALASQVIDNVIIPGYTDLEVESGELVTALKALTASPSATTVDAARAQWRATRAPWEAGEGHIFGPVDTLGVDPKVDSWPVDTALLDGALGGYDAEISDVDGFPVNMKGFHAMEYLLFGDGATLETAAAAATRLQTVLGEDVVADKLRLNYLEDLGESFDRDIKALVNAW